MPQWSKEFARFSDGVEIILCKGTPNQREKAFNAFDASNDKPTVIALREIAEGHITPAILEEIDQPSPEEFMQPDIADDILPMRGISIGD